MQEAVVAYPTEAFGQDVLQHQPQEVGTRERSGLGFSAFALDVAEGNLAIFVVEYLLFADDTAIEVLGQVLQGRLSPTDTLTLHHPFIGVDGTSSPSS